MNIQQLEYLIAVDNFRHFAKAAEVCCVTQPTLSMMIQKMEDELGVKIFDRSKHPIEPTEIGKKIIEQARVSLLQLKQITEIVDNEKQIVKGSFILGIIPTIASYLVPEILARQQNQYSETELILRERTTTELISDIMKGVVDGGILAGPLNHPDIEEIPLYYEKFYAYVSPLDKLHQEKEIDLSLIDIHNVWLLENEHCLRGQIERLCKMKRVDSNIAVRYESGSIETLIHVVDYNPGITIIPEMHAMGLTEDQQEHLRPFKDITAVREVSLIVRKDYVRRTMLDIIKTLVKESVPKSMQDPKLKEYVVNL
ncbi:MAG: hydrogen peroxide-inducible genes activator [Bacteroidales bacterium]|jgi:LysR family hydrogen peroxide-inducible transcriptional activator|nr:hydrogen peroxide-inducible genes activator [Bacteroidales bacterium]